MKKTIILCPMVSIFGNIYFRKLKKKIVYFTVFLCLIIGYNKTLFAVTVEGEVAGGLFERMDDFSIMAGWKDGYIGRIKLAVRFSRYFRTGIGYSFWKSDLKFREIFGSSIVEEKGSSDWQAIEQWEEWYYNLTGLFLL